MTATTPPTHTGIWVYLEHDEGRILPVGLELLGKARELAAAVKEPVTALVLGREGAEVARAAIAHGADAALVADHPLLVPFTTEVHTKAMTQLIQERRPNIVLVGATPNGRDLAGRLAIRLATGLTANATRLEIDAAKRILISAVPGFGGAVLALIKNERALPQISTVRPGVFPRPIPDADRKGAVQRAAVSLTPADVKCVVLQRSITAREDIGGAPVVVVAGLGTGGELGSIQELAGLLGGSVGVTRPLVDMGVASRDRQVGSTGIALRAQLAVVVGASGASHFTSGLRGVDTVVAINKDEHAEIFHHADVCVVADWAELASQLLRELRAKRTVVA